MRALLLGPQEIERIRAAVERARARPIPFDVLRAAAFPEQGKFSMTLADRAPVEHKRPQSEHVALPVGFHLAVSFEDQPAGMCMHLSISVDQPGKLPNPAAVKAIVETCLRSTPHDPAGGSHHWIEEFLIDGKPGGQAVNIIYVVAPAQEGHA